MKDHEYYVEDFIQKLDGQTYHFIQEVARRMIWKAEMMSKLPTKDL